MPDQINSSGNRGHEGEFAGRGVALDARHSSTDQAARGDLDRLYDSRFSADDAAAKDRIWAEICRYLQRFVVPNAPVLDVAADRGHFIRNIQASERWATDLRDVGEHLGPDI